MTKEQYEKWSAPFRKMKNGAHVLTIADRVLTGLVFTSYPLLLIYLFWTGNASKLWSCIGIPAASFALVSFFRKCFSAPRPYEKLDIKPLLKKETAGKSFPSRHVFSAFMIGMTYFYICMPLGAAIGFCGAMLAVVRVAGGVHFPIDTAAGAALGIFCGLFYFILQ